MCEHYQINCKIKAECCQQFFACRQCHNLSENHSIDRYSIKTVQCVKCNTIQEKSNQCNSCGDKFSNYYCNQCNLWCETVCYHCELCNICYKFTPDERFHCDICNLCFQNEPPHVCSQKKVNKDQECCICLEALYYQVSPPTMLKCQHWVHSNCLQNLLKSGKYQCPLCKKTMMDMDWSGFKEIIKMIPISEEETKTVEIFCNDCLIKTTCNYHPLGMECGQCQGYNTNL
jgi:RING finger and CHY zinc finger domain-containing protein 1